MSTKLIFTLGTGDYKLINYELNGQTYETRFAAIASRFFHDTCNPDNPVVAAWVIVTPESKKKNLQHLEAAWPIDLPLKLIELSDASQVKSWWGLFDRVAEVISEGDRLVLDITHGFRSMPILSLLMISFLKTVRNADLSMLSYGALDATENNLTPVFDLTPLVSLLDWTQAVNLFDRSGDSRQLAQLIDAQNRQHYKESKGADGPKTLARLATQLKDFSLSLQTFRYEAAADTAQKLERTLQGFSTSPADREVSPALHLLEPRIRHAIAPFTNTTNQIVSDLSVQRQLLEWFYQRQQYLPYIALLAETLIEYMAQALNIASLVGAIDNRDLKRVHHYTSTILTGFEHDLKGAQEEAEEKPWRIGNFVVDEALNQLDQTTLKQQIKVEETLLKAATLYAQVRPLRNSLMHADWSADEATNSGSAIQKKVETFHAQVLGILDSRSDRA